ncbi:MAG: 23S rRNA (uracil(1939)-C(5))-methyltransferase RlmD [Ruminococcaceae bacterium]|nr:23S rRNA (uracil(1939)-C(5))-methyltransferase RlmD [Oscillospiraceae bacterium]
MICPHAKKCNGCQLLNLTYEEQLSHKQAKLIGLLGRFCHVDEIIGMDEPYHYRNKVQAAFCSKSGKVVSGVYQSASRKIVPVDECLLNDKIADAIVLTVRKLCPGFKIKPYDMRTGKGYLRHVLVRRAFATGEVMCVLVTAPGVFSSARSFTNELIRRHPEIKTVVHCVNSTDTGLFLGKNSTVLYGNGYITDELCGLKFRISPRSFYQVNHVQTEKLYTYVKEFASLTGKEKLLDAYCGTGTIGLIMSDKCASVLGVEINKDAIADARVNAKINGIGNAKFIAADAGEVINELTSNGEHFDTVITDPPRAGCSYKFIKSVAELSPDRVVYVSCNPETLARDLGIFKKLGYKAERIQPFDMFPHTDHVETAVSLIRQKSTHQMKLHEAPFESIKKGDKTIELRLYDEKRKKIKSGDIIEFTNTASGEKLTAKVIKIHVFESFAELYRSLPLDRCGYTKDEIHSARPEDMELYYSKEEQKNYGVVGIEIAVNN